MTDAWAVVLAALIGVLATVVSGLQSQRHDKREREAIREELDLLDSLPDEASRVHLRDHVRVRLLRYILHEHSRTNRLRRSIAIYLLLISSILWAWLSTQESPFTNNDLDAWSIGALIVCFLLLNQAAYLLWRLLRRRQRSEESAMRLLVRNRQEAEEKAANEAAEEAERAARRGVWARLQRWLAPRTGPHARR
ncbi:hypothetical protein [Kineococcus terrestris]|uniref:hypothetical protein n=1 Tax=Kineococcus terrestris TaxID=2044856 RepID=UPI0034DB6E9E